MPSSFVYPEFDSLRSLFSSVATINGVGPTTAHLLQKLGCTIIRDLLWHLPQEVQIRRFSPAIKFACPNELITLQVRVINHSVLRKQKGRLTSYRVICSDSEDSIELVFFNPNLSYLKNALVVGSEVIISGRFEIYKGRFQMTHPDHIGPLTSRAFWEGAEPIYPLTQGLPQKMLQKIIKASLIKCPQLPEWLSSHILKKYHWPSWQTALQKLHSPSHENDLHLGHTCRRRLAYDEILSNQLSLILTRCQAEVAQGHALTGDGHLQQKVLETLPFNLTQDQVKALAEIQQDMASSSRMVRLLQGDVGSGKTIVAFLCMVKAVEAGYQVALLAPTEILARQHYKTMEDWARTAGVSLELLIGKDTTKRRQKIYQSLAEGDVNIVIGTHALIQPEVQFKNLGFIVIDEQHRFGVEQRLNLSEKGINIDILSMTATPIPRTLMLTVFGDLSSSYLRQKPSNRKDIITTTIPLARLNEIVMSLKRALHKGDKVYWVCPLIEESESLDLAAAEERFAMLQTLFPEKVGLIHGRLRSHEKEVTMQAFIEGSIKILVATTVIEVGVHVEDASVIIIEHAERFGLAQLHQLRGRIGRGSQESYCLLLYGESLNPTARARLNVMRSTTDGFKIAEEDLKLRGGGEAFGVKQSGMPSFKFFDPIAHQDLLLQAHDNARAILSKDPHLLGPQGQALRILLRLFEKEQTFKYLKAA
ncbi:hypothetical protein IM40_00060 [Candidatus Paracaedimonas acanthamoebae]|nr:hypothetical protein IM40_00060 [Candidatus Paracaedimonas acanthamoebae]